MDLRSKVIYHAVNFSLDPGDTTEGRDIPEELKKQMLEDHPEWFEVIGGSHKEVERVETPEDGLVIETPEAKMAKPRKK